MSRRSQGPLAATAPVASISGTVSVGGTLTAASSGAPTYQWKRDGVSIGGATSSTYTPVAADITPTVPGQLVGPAITCAVTQNGQTTVTNALTYSVLASLGANLKAWWRGDLGLNVGQTNVWLDRVAGEALANSTAGQRGSTRTVNGLTAWDADGVDDRLLTLSDMSALYGTPGQLEVTTVVVADTLEAVTQFNTPMLFGGNVNNWLDLGLGSAAAHFIMTTQAGANKDAISGAAPSTGVTYRVRAGWDGTNAFVKLGSGAQVTIAAADHHSSSYTGNKQMLGWNAQQNHFLDGAVCELLVVTTLALTASQRTDLDAWLLRWGATV